jgi:hypothetical protein
VPKKRFVKTHCYMGHEYSPENTRYFTNIHGKPSRQCKACGNDRYRRKYRLDPEFRSKRIEGNTKSRLKRQQRKRPFQCQEISTATSQTSTPSSA